MTAPGWAGLLAIETAAEVECACSQEPTQTHINESVGRCGRRIETREKHAGKLLGECEKIVAHWRAEPTAGSQ